MPLFALALVLGAWLFAAKPQSPHRRVVAAAKRGDVAAMKGLAPTFLPTSGRLAIESTAAAMQATNPPPSSNEVLEALASALVMSGAASGAWGDAFVHAGRYDLGTKLAEASLPKR